MKNQSGRYREQLEIYDLNTALDVDITITGYPAGIRVWMNDSDIQNLTANNNYRDVTEQMALVSSAIRKKVSNIAGLYDIEITNERFGVSKGMMYILYYGVCCRNRNLKED